MAFIHGKGTAVLYNKYNLSSYFNDASASHSVETAETTAFGDDDKTYITGLRDGTISMSGMFDGSANAVDDVLRSSLGTNDAGVVSVVYDGATAGNRASLAKAETTSYDISMPVGDVVAASADFQVDAGLRQGVALVNLAAVSATGQATGVDTGASGTSLVAHLHVTANDHDGTLDVKLQSSTTLGGVYADITGAAFTQIASSTTSSERITVANSYNQFVRVSYTLAGSSGSATIFVAFAAN